MTTLPTSTSGPEDPAAEQVFDAASPNHVIAALLAQRGLTVVPLTATGEPREMRKPLSDLDTVIDWFFKERPRDGVGVDLGEVVQPVPSELTIDTLDAWVDEVQQQTGHLFEWVSAADLHRENIPDPGWIIEGIFPGDAYGTFAGEAKAGKTWAACDLAVSVATGGKWLDTYHCEKGTVAYFLGEGGRRNTRRRLRAIAEHKDVDLGTVEDLFLFERVPHFDDQMSMIVFARTLRRLRPRLVIIDPLYFAAAGGDGASLYSMGRLLESAQLAAHEAGAALLLIHHFNQSGRGGGARRMSGAGPEEWSRVLGAVTAKELDSPAGMSKVYMAWVFTGGEISTHYLWMERTVWADDPHDLTSPLHYHIEWASGPKVDDTGPNLRGAKKAVVDALGTEWTSTADVIRSVEAAGHDYRERTIKGALATLAGDEVVERQGEAGTGYEYRL